LLLISGLIAVFAGLAWLLFALAGYREGMVNLPGDGSRLETLADPRPELTLAEAAAAPATAWREWPGTTYLVAAAGKATWLRVRLRNPGENPMQGVLSDSEYLPDRVDAWWRAEEGGWRHFAAGESIAGAHKPLWGRTAAFPVTVRAGGEQTVFLRVTDRYNAYLWPRWWPRAADFYQAQMRDTLAEAICYGGLLALLLYNSVLWLRLRFPDIGAYVPYAGAMLLFNFLSNGGPALLGFGLGSPGKEMLVGGALALSGAFVIQFARMFLGTAATAPGPDRWLRVARRGWLVMAASAAAVPWFSAPLWFDGIVALIALTHLSLLAVALLVWRRGVGHARFFIAAFGLLFIGALPAVVAWLGQDMRAWAAMTLLAGSLLEMLLLSFALADRFAQTQSRLVEETEQRRMIEQTYADELEIEVRERTRELQEANADKDRLLVVIGHDLRSPLTGLMRAADGEPGEFARDVSRIGRALLLLIEDLALWARLRAGTRALAVHPAAAVTAAAVALHRTLAGQDRIVLVVAVPEGLRVGTDLVLAQTLVRNLLANALKFARSQVELRAECTAEGVRFSVRNDGAPLPPEVAARFTANLDEPLSATGGLGLRLCREICQALGTRLEAGSVAGGGTEFTFTLREAAAGEKSLHPFP
jgi:signal transduction histidine kinase